MLPYVYLDETKLGAIKSFGLMVGIAFAVGDFFMLRRVRRLGYDEAAFRSLRRWALVAGLFFSHFLDQLVCRPAEILHRPWSVLFVWESASSLGGISGAILGGFLWKYVAWEKRGFAWRPVRRARPLDVLPFADVVQSVFPLAWIFGRAGCSLVHDHPGVLAPAGSWFAVAWPTGADDGVHHALGPLRWVWGSTLRWDLGLLEMLFTIVLAAAFVATWPRRLPVGTYVAAECLAYAPVRFAMDFLRLPDPAADPRFVGMTFAQWSAIGLFVIGVAMAMRIRKRARLSYLAPR